MTYLYKTTIEHYRGTTLILRGVALRRGQPKTDLPLDTIRCVISRIEDDGMLAPVLTKQTGDPGVTQLNDGTFLIEFAANQTLPATLPDERYDIDIELYDNATQHEWKLAKALLVLIPSSQ